MKAASRLTAARAGQQGSGSGPRDKAWRSTSKMPCTGRESGKRQLLFLCRELRELSWRSAREADSSAQMLMMHRSEQPLFLLGFRGSMLQTGDVPGFTLYALNTPKLVKPVLHRRAYSRLQREQRACFRAALLALSLGCSCSFQTLSIPALKSVFLLNVYRT